jgi:hypothetical protein
MPGCISNCSSNRACDSNYFACSNAFYSLPSVLPGDIIESGDIDSIKNALNDYRIVSRTALWGSYLAGCPFNNFPLCPANYNIFGFVDKNAGDVITAADHNHVFDAITLLFDYAYASPGTKLSTSVTADDSNILAIDIIRKQIDVGTLANNCQCVGNCTCNTNCLCNSDCSCNYGSCPSFCTAFCSCNSNFL